MTSRHEIIPFRDKYRVMWEDEDGRAWTSNKFDTHEGAKIYIDKMLRVNEIEQKVKVSIAVGGKTNDGENQTESEDRLSRLKL